MDLVILPLSESKGKNLAKSRNYRFFTEPVLGEILQSLRSFRMTVSEGFRMTKRDFHMTINLILNLNPYF